MAAAQTFSNELTSLLGLLPQPQLVEICRRAALGGLGAICKQTLGETSLEMALKSLFSDFPHEKIIQTAREIGLCAIRNTAWNQLLSLPGQWHVRIRCANPEAARALKERKGPAIITFWHLGATHMVPLALESIGVSSLIISRLAPAPWFRRAVSKDMEMAVINNDPRQSAIALKRALDRLRQGGVVTIATDGSQGQQNLSVPYLGRQLQISRGLAALSRLTKAPVIPVVVTWAEMDWGMVFRLFDPIAAPAKTTAAPVEWEREFLTETVRRFEEITRAIPGQCRIDHLGRVLKSPLV